MEFPTISLITKKCNICFIFWSFILGTNEFVGESTLLGGQIKEFPNMCMNYTLAKCVTFNFGFHF
jgi:hypothetical protein